MYTILGFTRSRSYPPDDTAGFYQLIAGSYKGDRHVNIFGIDKIQLKCDCIQGSIIIATREPILYSFASSLPPGLKICNEPRIKFFKKVNNLNKSILSHITFYLEDEDRKSVDFKGETLTFTLQMIKIKYSYLHKF